MKNYNAPTVAKRYRARHDKTTKKTRIAVGTVTVPWFYCAANMLIKISLLKY